MILDLSYPWICRLSRGFGWNPKLFGRINTDETNWKYSPARRTPQIGAVSVASNHCAGNWIVCHRSGAHLLAGSFWGLVKNLVVLSCTTDHSFYSLLCRPNGTDEKNAANRMGLGWRCFILALLRAVVLIPGYSGHALFLAYSLFSSQSWVARITAGLVLVEVAYLKIFVWQDKTIIGGILLALAASGVFRWLLNRPKIHDD